MKCIKKVPTILFVIIPIILVFTLVYVFYLSGQKVYKEELQIRPLSELLDMDFPEAEEETIQDLSVCDSSRIIEEWERDKAKWPGHEKTKLTLLDNCWREYENEHFKFRFRDINDSAVIVRQKGANIKEGVNVRLDNLNDKKIFSLAFSGVTKEKDENYPIKLTSDLYNIVSVNKFLIKDDVYIYRIEYEFESAVGIRIKKYYTLSLDDKNFLSLYSDSGRFIKESLPTIEIK